MASTRGKARPKTRANLRQISRIINFEPRRISNLPVDPPPIKTSFHYNNVLEFQVRLSSSATAVKPGFINIEYTPGTTKNLSWAQITVSDLTLAWLKFLQIETDSSGLDMEISILRVVYWGPSRMELTGLPIGLVVDINPPSSSMSLRDTGTTTARARVGVTVPQHVWYEENNKTDVIRIAPDPDSTFIKAAAPLLKEIKEGLVIGTVHVTIAVRRTRTF